MRCEFSKESIRNSKITPKSEKVPMFPFMLGSLEDRGDGAMVRGGLESLVGEGNVHE